MIPPKQNSRKEKFTKTENRSAVGQAWKQD